MRGSLSSYEAVPRSSSRAAHVAASRSASSSSESTRGSWLRRIPWSAVVLSVIVLVAALFPTAPVRDAATLAPVGEAHLQMSAAYVALAPISTSLDTLTLLTVAQHIALFLWAIVAFIAWRVWWHRRVASTLGREIIRAVGFLAIVAAVYMAAAMMPRPMAQLDISDPTVFAIDFHAHTKYSHDGRRGWGPEDVRAWHRGAGFDAVYITDHRTLQGAEEGIAANPSEAGEGTMILQGLEAVERGQHVNILGAGRRYRGITTPDLRDVDTAAMRLASLIPANEPIIVQTMPDDLHNVFAADGPGTAGARAIELIDGSPRGLAQTRTQRAEIVHLADSLNLALVAGSDNHGWGMAAPGWTLMRAAGWRGMPTDSLSSVVERILRVGRRTSTRVVERRVASGDTPLALIGTGVIVPWRLFTMLPDDARVMWLVWIWAVAIVARGLRAYRIRPSSRA